METREVNLHPRQFDSFNFLTQYAAAISGIQGGKTFVGAYWAANQIQTMPDGGYGAIVAPTYKILAQSTLPKFFQEFPNLRKYYKEQKGEMNFPGNKTVYIRSAENPYSLEGMTLDWAWGDEAGAFALLVLTILRSRTAIKRGKIFYTTTPYNMGALYQTFYKPWKDGTDKDLSVFQWQSIDNPYFPKDFFEKEKKRLRPEEFARRYLGEFTRMQGLVYMLNSWHLVDWQNQKAEITLAGIDWGWSNPAAIIVIKLVQGQYFIVDEWYEINKTTGQIIETAQALQNKWGVNRFYADSANPEKIAEANTNTGLYVLPYEKLKDSLTAGVSYINGLLMENRLFVDRKLSNALAEFETYQYPEPDDNGLIKRDEPMPFNNHLMDAMRYAIMGYQPAHRARVPKADETFTQIAVRRLLDNKQINANRGEDYI